MIEFLKHDIVCYYTWCQYNLFAGFRIIVIFTEFYYRDNDIWCIIVFDVNFADL